MFTKPMLVAAGVASMGIGVFVTSLGFAFAADERGSAEELHRALMAIGTLHPCTSLDNVEPCQRLDFHLDNEKTFTGLASVGGGLMGMSAVLIAWVLLQSPPQGSSTASVRPGFSVGPSGGALTIGGSF